MMKCNTCKYETVCENYCFLNSKYEPSIYKLIKKRLKERIIKVLRLEKTDD